MYPALLILQLIGSVHNEFFNEHLFSVFYIHRLFHVESVMNWNMIYEDMYSQTYSTVSKGIDYDDFILAF